MWLGELTVPDMIIHVDWDVKHQTKQLTVLYPVHVIMKDTL